MLTDTWSTQETDHVRRLKRLLEAGRLLNSTLELTELTDIALRIVREVVPVDRCTLFVVDHKQELLRSFVAQGVDRFEITVPLGHGLAGTAATTGQPLEVTDAYQDERFLNEFDNRLAYHTKDVFCMPVFDRKGTVTGVLELLNRLRPLTDEDKEFLSGMCSYLGMAIHNAWVHSELLESKKIEEELKLVRDRLMQAEKLSVIGELVAGIVHEVKNPLAAALGHCGLLREDRELTPDIASRVTKIEGLITRGLKTATGFLSFARKVEGERVPTDLNGIIRQTVDLLDYESRIRRVTVVVQVEKLPLIRIDSGKIQQVLVNLLKNAHEANEDGTVTVRSLHDTEKQVIRIDVADDGPGVPPEVQGRLFEPFFTTKPRGSGTGLGLTVSRRIIEEHQGTLSFESGPERGSTFHIELPLPL